MTAAIRHEIEDFHIHTSILLDRIVGIYEPYFGEKNAVVSGNHEAFLNNLKHRPDINYLPATLITGAKWLQDNVDWYRNRLIIHPAGYEKNGFQQGELTHVRQSATRGRRPNEGNRQGEILPAFYERTPRL